MEVKPVEKASGPGVFGIQITLNGELCPFKLEFPVPPEIPEMFKQPFSEERMLMVFRMLLDSAHQKVGPMEIIVGASNLKEMLEKESVEIDGHTLRLHGDFPCNPDLLRDAAALLLERTVESEKP